MGFRLKAPLSQLFFPGLSPRPDAIGLFGHLRLQLAARSSELQARACLFAQAVLLTGLTKKTQEIQPRFGVGRAKAGEQFITDVCANGRLALMASRGVVAVQVAADLASGRQQLVFLSVKALMPIEQQVGKLTGGNVHAQFAELLE